MISVEDVKDLIISVVAAMVDKVRMAEERTKYPFANRTNIYRCEDGRPICYCCLRVGHVAKYCWEKRYSCCHVSPMDLSPPQRSIPVASIEVESINRDIGELVQKLKDITTELDKREINFGTEPNRQTGVFVDNDEGGDIEDKNRESLVVLSEEIQQKQNLYTYAECLNPRLYQASDNVSRISDNYGIT